MRYFIINWLDPIGIVIGLLLAIPIFLTLWNISFGRKRLHRRWFKKARSGEMADAVLVVDLLARDDMKPAVLKYLAQQEITVADDSVFVMRNEGDIVPDSLPKLVQELRNKLADISQLAPDELHLFYGGPAAFAMIIGAELSNSGTVHVYQNTRGQYSNWGPIRHAHF